MNPETYIRYFLFAGSLYRWATALRQPNSDLKLIADEMGKQADGLMNICRAASGDDTPERGLKRE